MGLMGQHLLHGLLTVAGQIDRHASPLQQGSGDFLVQFAVFYQQDRRADQRGCLLGHPGLLDFSRRLSWLGRGVVQVGAQRLRRRVRLLPLAQPDGEPERAALAGRAVHPHGAAHQAGQVALAQGAVEVDVARDAGRAGGAAAGVGHL